MKRTVLSLLWVGGSLAYAGVLQADWVVMKGGHRVEVTSVEVTATAITVVTLNGKFWSMTRDAVDVPATLAANGRAPTPVLSEDSPTLSQEPPSKTISAPSPPPDEVPVSKTAESPTSRLPSPPSGHPKAAVFVNGAITTSAALGFTQTRAFELFHEDALINTSYRDSQSQGMEIGAVFWLKGSLGVRGSAELFRNDRSAAFEAFLPHPFFFERFRELSGSRPNLSHEEIALHLGPVLSAHWGDAFFVDVSGGPSLFITRTELLVDVLYEEVYPYDTVTPLGAEFTVFEERPVGFNLGVSATYRIAGPVGVDFGARFSRARVQISPTEGHLVEFDVGGLRAAAGLRLLFR